MTRSRRPGPCLVVGATPRPKGKSKTQGAKGKRQRPAPRRRRPLRSLEDLVPDPQNANKGTKRGQAMLEHSIAEYGPGRSILADKYGTVIAGSKTLQKAIAAGLKMQLVKTRGDRLVVHQREDLDLARDPKAKALGLADNRVAQVDLDFDAGVVDQLREQGVDVSQLWTEQELVRFIAKAGGAEPAEVQAKEQWAVLVFCPSEKEQQRFIGRMQKEGRECRALMS